MIVDGTIDTERDPFEPPEDTDDEGYAYTEDDLFCAVRKAARSEDKVIEDMCKHQHGEVQGRELYRV